MADVTSSPFGTYTSVEIVVQDSKDEINANLASFRALIAAQVASDVGSASQPHPDFDFIPEPTRALIDAEIVAIIAAVEAMPEA